MIPKKIWQTYECDYDSLPAYAYKSTRTWIDLHPEWEYNYVNAEERREFVSKEFGKDWLDIFDNKCPLGVMKADLWRIMAIYIHGGLYADLDTDCYIPVEQWPDEDVFAHRVFLSPEHSIHFLNATFLAEAQHPLLQSVLDEIWSRMKNPDFSDPHFVHRLVGPAVFTTGIYNFSQINSDELNISGYDPVTVLDLKNPEDVEQFNSREKCVEYGVYLTKQSRMLHETAVKQLYGSQFWNDGQYVQWIHETDRIINAAR
jgi:mannosyltransferase OCH1-like enzyme